MTVAQVLEHYTFIKAVCAGRSLPARVLRTTPMAFLFYLFNVADVAVEGRQLLHSRLYLIEYTSWWAQGCGSHSTGSCP